MGASRLRVSEDFEYSLSIAKKLNKVKIFDIFHIFTFRK